MTKSEVFYMGLFLWSLTATIFPHLFFSNFTVNPPSMRWVTIPILIISVFLIYDYHYSEDPFMPTARHRLENDS